jgi:hypothetical protein
MVEFFGMLLFELLALLLPILPPLPLLFVSSSLVLVGGLVLAARKSL